MFNDTTRTAMLALLALVAAVGIGAAATTGSVSITVNDSAGNTVENATVELYTTDDTLHDTVKTNENGTADFSGVETGNYTANISADGYESMSTDITVTENSTATTTATLNATEETENGTFWGGAEAPSEDTVRYTYYALGILALLGSFALMVREDE